MFSDEEFCVHYAISGACDTCGGVVCGRWLLQQHTRQQLEKLSLPCPYCAGLQVSCIPWKVGCNRELTGDIWDDWRTTVTVGCEMNRLNDGDNVTKSAGVVSCKKKVMASTVKEDNASEQIHILKQNSERHVNVLNSDKEMNNVVQDEFSLVPVKNELNAVTTISCIVDENIDSYVLAENLEGPDITVSEKGSTINCDIQASAISKNNLLAWKLPYSGLPFPSDFLKEHFKPNAAADTHLRDCDGGRSSSSCDALSCSSTSTPPLQSPFITSNPLDDLSKVGSTNDPVTTNVSTPNEDLTMENTSSNCPASNLLHSQSNIASKDGFCSIVSNPILASHSQNIVSNSKGTLLPFMDMCVTISLTSEIDQSTSPPEIAVRLCPLASDRIFPGELSDTFPIYTDASTRKARSMTKTIYDTEPMY